MILMSDVLCTFLQNPRLGRKLQYAHFIYAWRVQLRLRTRFCI